MSVDRVKFQNIVESQVPDYVRDDFPLLADFLKQYYVSQEYQSGTTDLVQNIDQYVKVDELTSLKTSTILGANLSYTDTTVQTDSEGNFTEGFPERDGLIQVDDEIIYYEYKTDTSFENCRRGFSGVTSYEGSNTPDLLEFKSTLADSHNKGVEIKNLSILFLQKFFDKLKKQVTPGFSERSLFSGLDQRNFVFGSDSFYKSKGTDQSFEILFRALYGEDVEVIRPSDYLLRPSNANYKVTNDIVVEQYLGNPLDLKNRTLYQSSTGARGTVSNVKPVIYNGTTYYQISVDYGYDRDIDVRGSVFSEFVSTKKTRILNSVSVGSTYIDVDSTIGFPEAGSLITEDVDGNEYGIVYNGKNDNQFFNISSTTREIGRNSEINLFDIAYANINDSEQVQVKISAALKDITFEDDNYSIKKGDIIKFQSIGLEKNTKKTRYWDLNVKSHYKVEKLSVIDINAKSYSVTLSVENTLKAGHEVVFRDVDGNETRGTVSEIKSPKTFAVNTLNLLDITKEFTVENQVLYANSSKYGYLGKYFANVQNTYTKFNDDVLISSNSLPFYNNLDVSPYDKSLFFTGSATNNTITLVTSGDHGFFTGDTLYYTPGKTTTTSTDSDGNTVTTVVTSTFDDVVEGVYYVKRVDPQRIKLSKSKSNLFDNIFLTLNGSVTKAKFEYFDFYKKTFEPQPIYREISSPVNKSGEYNTIAGYTGILDNGVEILNYKSPNNVVYGDVKEFIVVNKGKDYDIINPPVLTVSDQVGTGATGIVNVKGQLERIDVLDTGFDYQERPFVSITGGNGKDASAEVRLSSVTHTVPFNAEGASALVSLGSSTIGFSTFHKFRDSEKVIYLTDGQKGVEGLTTSASYYVGVIDSKTIKLYETLDDSLTGINTVGLTRFGNGVHRFKSSTLKNIVTSVVVTNPGSGYENKERRIVGVNTSLNQIKINNHGYESREIVRYSSISTVEGLVESKDYYVVKVDDNNISLSEVGSGSTSVGYYYDNNILVNLKSTGTGSFNYKPIVVSVEGITGVSTRTGQDFSCQVQPVLRGNIESVDVTNGGVGYGSSEILNFNRQPVITVSSGSGARLTPVINNGQIVDVIVNDSGDGYNSPPDLEIETTTGKNASLTPVLKNGQIISVKIIKPGAGYVPNKTFIKVVPAGSDVSIDARINQWNINLFERNFNTITDDDGFLDININNDTLQYSHLYVPRPLRQNTFVISGTDLDNSVYGTPDLVTVNGEEITNTFHSPIIGWAYDGNPIYGPYGFADPTGSGTVKPMKSGYELKQNVSNRPDFSSYPLGFFVEDYVYTSSGDLDEHNGRFCVTPDFPNGIYAYFATINDVNDSVGPFAGFRRPQFPYFIGNTYHSVPNDFNFKLTSNQNEYDIQSDRWLRNTYFYNTNGNDNGYDYICNSNKDKIQNIEVTSASLGSVESVGILTGGIDYKINDSVIFDNTQSGGSGARAKVSSIEGKGIDTVTVDSLVLYNVEFLPFNDGSFVGFSTQVHNFNAGDIVNVTGLSSFFAGFDKSYNVGVRTDNFVSTLGITSMSTNDVDYIYLNGLLEFPYLRPDDILTIDQEKVRVLNIDTLTGRIRVQRAVEGSAGAAHTNSSILFENPKKLTINVGALKTTKSFNVNEVLYIDPSESVGVGTVLGTGIGNTVTFSNPGVGVSQVFLEPQSIYFPNHGLNLNDSVTYTPNGGTSLQVWSGNTDSAYVNLTEYQNLFAVPLSDNTIGISSNKVGLSSTGVYVGVNTNRALLYFTNVGAGNTHKFTTDLKDVITGEVSRNLVTVSTASTHGLSAFDRISMTIKPNTEETVTVKYNDFNRRIVFDPRDFTASDVDLVKNSISFSGEFFKLGDKVIHTSSSPSGGLENEEIYYVVPFNDTKVRLVREKYEVGLSNPNFIDITSASTGTLSRINPLINTKRNHTLKFDLSDSSLSFTSGGTKYSAFDMNLFRDSEYSNPFFTTGNSSSFEVVKTGTPGVDSNASLKLIVGDDVPSLLFYKFDSDNNDIVPSIKSDIVSDKDVPSNNTIEVVKTLYDGNYSIVGVGSTSFQYSIADVPDISLFNSNNSKLSYTTTSKTAKGSISKIKVTDGGTGYKQIPGITSVRTTTGKNAIVNITSKSIGKILSTKFEDIGYDYPTDQTVKVVSNIPEVLQVNTLQAFDNIGVTSAGKNYLINPQLIVLDGFTNDLVKDIDLRYQLGDTQVSILKNTNGLHDVTPTILPVLNSNGVGISSIVYTDSTKTVRVYLDAQFSNSQDFRYKTGAKVLIEGISLTGTSSTTRGYNLQDYDYSLFEVTSFDSQIGGANAYFEYSLEGYLKSGEVPGIMDPSTSSGRAVPESDFPVFDITLKPNNFFIDEVVTSGKKIGVVERWIPTNKRLIVSSSDEFVIGDRIIGESSGTQVVVEAKANFNATVSTGAGTTFISGWASGSGFLNDSLQRIPNNEYYQNLSYSLKSKVPLQTWDDAVSSLGHVAGLAKFGDLVVESTEDEVGGIIVSAAQSDVEIVLDIISSASIHCFHDFDNVTENSFYVNSDLVSDEVIFNNRILTDYNESIGNRVLSIDDISSEFRSIERATRFSNVSTFPNGYSYNKVLVYTKDVVLDNLRQVEFVSVLHDNVQGHISEYAQLDTKDLGYYDFVPSLDGTKWLLQFYPTDFAYNSYELTALSFSTVDNVSGVGTTSIGNIVDISSSKVNVSAGTTTTVVSIADTYRSSKLLVQAEGTDNNLSVVEMNMVHDGTNVYLLEYGNIETNTGLGTFSASISGSNIEIDFTPSVGTAVTVTSSIVSIANSSVTGVAGTNYLSYAKLESESVSIPSSASPGVTTITSYNDPTESSYYIVTVDDMTNSNYETFEVVSLRNVSGASEFVEYANVQSNGSLGQIGINTSQGSVDLTYTPNANIEVDVRVFSVGLEPVSITNRPSIIDLNSSVVKSSEGSYEGTLLDKRTTFGLKHDGNQIFLRGFDGSDPSIVDTTNNSIQIADHYFATGEAVRYTSPGTGSTAAITITSQNIPGVGVTDKLPTTVDLFVVAPNSKEIQFATTAANALSFNPTIVSIASTGIGIGHSITSTKQNQKVLVAIDNIVQSPVVAFGVTSSLAQDVVFQQQFRLSGISSIFANDLIRIGNEIMIVAGIAGTDTVNVLRARMGTTRDSHSTGDLVEKLSGEYNIVGNDINFSSAPKGPEPEETTADVDPDSVDFSGVTTTSSFQGRSFIRSAEVNSSDETYTTNYIFDNVSYKFTGLSSSFTLTNNGSNVTGVATRNPFVVLNGILQQPTGEQPPSLQVGDYRMAENAGITSITFTGNDGVPTGSDPNNGAYPTGGLLVSIGSSNGFGFQPLVSAGGTVTVSPTGTITSVSIGNSGSGYRTGIQTVVNVGVQTYSGGIPNIEFIGTAAVSGGHIVSVAITNPGAGYTGTNLPDVIFDDPLSYNDLELSYSPGFSGSGQGATVDVVVGQGSSVINFELRNPGFGYGNGERLTVSVGGTIGIPTDPNASFERFEILVDEVYSDRFNSWAVGDIEVLDTLDNEFDGFKTKFQITKNEIPYSIVARKGSPIDVEQTLIVFINDTLQKPGKSFTFNGGSVIQFSEAPKSGDTSKILFYQGSSGIDVKFVDIIETVKTGDTLDIDNNPELGQGIALDEEVRVVTGISTLDSVFTNTYAGPGITTDQTLARPVTWCKQLVDKVIDGEYVGKNRQNYEPLIYPASYLIQPVGLGSTIVYVDSVRPLYDGENESSVRSFQNKIEIVSQDSIVSTSATAVVSSAGTITSISITNPGAGYTQSPQVTISTPVGVGTTQRASATATVSSGSVSSITVVNPGTGYTTSNPPSVLIEDPRTIREEIDVLSYTGDYGTVVGLGTTDSGSQEQIIFDLFIPQDSFMRNIALVGTAVTISGISTGDYFTIYGTNTSIGNTFGTQRTDGSSIGVGTTALDMVYQAVSVEVKELTIPGIGQTHISRVVTNVDSYGVGFSTVSLPSLGNYSWGKINLDDRSQKRSFEFYGDNGYTGISTSGFVFRNVALKDDNYT